MDYSNEIQETLGRNYNIPDDIDEEELLGELDALEADMALEAGAGGGERERERRERRRMGDERRLRASERERNR